MERQLESKGWNICVQQIFVPLPPHHIAQLLLRWKGEDQMLVWTPHMLSLVLMADGSSTLAPIDFLGSHKSSCQKAKHHGKAKPRLCDVLAALSCSIYLSSAEHPYPLIYACITAALSQKEEVA